MNDTMGYRDRGKVLQIIGALFLLGSISAAFLGPIELYCFYLFSEGGRFHYAGFGFGSFMFANIASQIIGYYLIAVLGVALGYGHLKLRRWVRPLTVTLLWFWLVMGIPLMIVVYGMYIQAKDPTVMQFAITLPFAAIIYPIAPIHLYRLYRGRDVKGTDVIGCIGLHHCLTFGKIPETVTKIKGLDIFRLQLSLVNCIHGCFREELYRGFLGCKGKRCMSGSYDCYFSQCATSSFHKTLLTAYVKQPVPGQSWYVKPYKVDLGLVNGK